MRPVRVLIVDDSPTMRQLLGATLAQDPEIEVAGTASDPYVARQMIKDLNPDVITLDIEMPRMDGIAFLEKIMRLRPMPVVMVSTLTKRGAGATLEALELGAVDYFAKPTTDVATALQRDGAQLATKVKAAARARLRPRPARPAPAAPAEDYRPGRKVVAIGASMGGIDAIIAVLSHFPENCPPTAITQHMPAQFTQMFAQRLDRLCRPKVSEATEGAPLVPGHVYVAPGGDAHLEIVGGDRPHCKLRRAAAIEGHCPSVDALFFSAANAFGKEAVGVILTGMGRDGANGLKAMRERGALTIGQDEASCVIYGMPRVAFELGAVQRQLPLEDIGPEILRVCAAQD